MNILMLTNTYAPHIGGVARSVEQFAAAHRGAGHRTLVVAPDFEGAEESPGVVRVPAVQHFNGTGFSLPLPLPGYLDGAIEDFRPDVVHANHPFLLGDTALRIAASWDSPVVFTHHTLYQKYTHYVVGGSATLKRFVTDLAAGYGNLCDAVVAPSESIRQMLVEHGVERPIEVIPTGVDAERFAGGDGGGPRRSLGIPPKAFVVGHVGRLAPEKNLRFLAQSAARFLNADARAWLLVVGEGPSKAEFLGALEPIGAADRLVAPGNLSGSSLVDAYHVMDVFAFASLSETQGMVLTEAMAAGVPVVALNGPGVRETVRDHENGLLLPAPDRAAFAGALRWIRQLSPSRRERLRAAARETANDFSLTATAARMENLYARLIAAGACEHHHDLWSVAQRRVAQEWALWQNMLASAGDAVLHPDLTRT